MARKLGDERDIVHFPFFSGSFLSQNKTGKPSIVDVHVLVYSPAILLSECAVSRVVPNLDGGGVGLELDDMRVKR
jgi:hypothetical protein